MALHLHAFFYKILDSKMFPSPNQASDFVIIHSVILEEKLLLSNMNSRCHGAKESLSTLLSTNKNLTHRSAVSQLIYKNGDVANRAISKTGHLDRHVGNRTVSKLQAICNSSGQEVLFPLYGVFMFENYANFKI
jgi:hypothetical protein